MRDHDSAVITNNGVTFAVGQKVICLGETGSSESRVVQGEVRIITRIKNGDWLYFHDTPEGCGYGFGNFLPLDDYEVRTKTKKSMWLSDELWDCPA